MLTFLRRAALALALFAVTAAPAHAECSIFTVTAYTHTGNLTATGLSTYGNVGNIVAVDPDVIPLHSSVWIEGEGLFQAEDTGGGVVGYWADILMGSYNAAIRFGRQLRTVCW